jgi:hypothetical protein
MDVLLLGVGSSVASEALTWLGKKLAGTVLQGQAAFILSLVCAFGVGVYKTLQSGNSFTDWTSLVKFTAEAFGFSQVFFQLIYSKFQSLQVQPTVTA